jgi:hypothetical protein
MTTENQEASPEGAKEAGLPDLSAMLRQMGAVEIKMDDANPAAAAIREMIRTRIMGDDLPGESIEPKSRPATHAEARALIDPWRDQYPEIGDVLEATDRVGIMRADMKPGTRAVVTLVLPVPQLYPDSLRGYPVALHTIGLAFMVAPKNSETALLIEHLHDHRDFKRVGSIFDEVPPEQTATTKE